MKTDKNSSIINFIEFEQRGRVGIYPYKITQDVAVKFNISITDASKYVINHIKQELKKHYENLSA